ncbi:imm11 family protein [Myxococcus guangdongensis]|uniref:imm11 family protein n=1 Tax=Myxococcus guangdongensis TaxID=2906760 RepID=UPI003898F536
MTTLALERNPVAHATWAIPASGTRNPGCGRWLATRFVRCIDDKASKEVQYWMPEDERPEKIGHYRGVIDLRIDRAQVGNAKVFRTWGWSVALIVSEDIKAALGAAKITGARFEEV